MEVVIAVGFGFVLTAILGLAALAANETKNADLKARLAWITESVTSEIKASAFRRRWESSLDQLGISSGMPLPDSNGAYFRCDVVNVTPPPASPNFTTNNFRVAPAHRSLAESEPDLDKCVAHLAIQLPVRDCLSRQGGLLSWSCWSPRRYSSRYHLFWSR